MEENLFKINLQLFADESTDQEPVVDDEKAVDTENESSVHEQELKNQKQAVENAMEMIKQLRAEIDESNKIKVELENERKKREELEEIVKSSEDKKMQDKIKEQQRLKEEEAQIQAQKEAIELAEKARAEKEQKELEWEEKLKSIEADRARERFEVKIKFEKLSKPWLSDELDKIEDEKDYESFLKFYPQEKQDKIRQEYESKKKAGTQYFKPVDPEKTKDNSGEKPKLSRAEQRIADIINKKRV